MSYILTVLLLIQLPSGEQVEDKRQSLTVGKQACLEARAEAQVILRMALGQETDDGRKLVGYAVTCELNTIAKAIEQHL